MRCASSFAVTLEGTREGGFDASKKSAVRSLALGLDVHAVSCSPDGSLAAVACDDMRIRLWNIDQNRIVKTWKAHTRKVNSVSFSPDGRWLASGSDDGTVRLWDTEYQVETDDASRRKPITNSIGMQLVPVSPGSFAMGSPASDKMADADEKP